MKIAVDFDGTIVEHKYPEIGKELENAVNYCSQNGIEFYAVNKSYPEEIFVPDKVSRKIDVDLFIDDRNIGGFLGWSTIWKMLNPDDFIEEDDEDELDILQNKSSKSRGLKKFFK